MYCSIHISISLVYLPMNLPIMYCRGVLEGQEEVHEERRGLHQEERGEAPLRLN